MILNTGSRTDIPAFYSEWFYNRVREGCVLARNPFYPQQVSRYRIDPEVVDLLVFCTKNPAPMLDRLSELDRFRQFWFVTVTPYGKEIEPGVPEKGDVIESVRRLSAAVGADCVSWRYDPIFLSETYPVEYHLEAFERMAAALEGATHQAVISFIDLYEKTKKNFPEVREVGREDRLRLGAGIAEAAARHGMRVRTCLEGRDLAPFGIDTGGCMTKEVLEAALGEELRVPAGHAQTREGCQCLLGNDIGAYNTCRHFCRYCYANYDRESVLRNSARHDPASPLLVGHLTEADEVKDAKQTRWRTGQMRLW